MAWLAALGVAVCAYATEPESAPTLDTVLVYGEQPGPGLWKVSKGDHVMWILGSYEPLPRDMKWRSKDVEALIGKSQEVLLSGRADVRPAIGMLKGLTLLPAAYRAALNPNNAQLRDVVSVDAYARWEVLKRKYLGSDDRLERWRPAIAAARLRWKAIEKNGLRSGSRILDVVRGAATRNAVRVRTAPSVSRRVDVGNVRGMLNSARNVQLPDAQCFAGSLERLEPDIETLRARANAWATGDIAAMRTLGNVAVGADECSALLTQVLTGGDIPDLAAAEKVLADMRHETKLADEEVERGWLEAAERALDRNKITFAVLPIDVLLDANGYVPKLRARGYAVEEPQ